MKIKNCKSQCDLSSSTVLQRNDEFDHDKMKWMGRTLAPAATAPQIVQGSVRRADPRIPAPSTPTRDEFKSH